MAYAILVGLRINQDEFLKPLLINILENKPLHTLYLHMLYFNNLGFQSKSQKQALATMI